MRVSENVIEQVHCPACGHAEILMQAFGTLHTKLLHNTASQRLAYIVSETYLDSLQTDCCGELQN